ncbi:3188_t:CDS:2, partial [Funneliformis mosseae]
FSKTQLYTHQVSRLFLKKTSTNSDMGLPKAWFKLMNLESAFDRVLLEEIEYVMVEDINQAREQDAEKNLIFIFKDCNMTVSDYVTSMQKFFAENIHPIPVAKKAQIDTTLTFILAGKMLRCQYNLPENLNHKIYTLMLVPEGSEIGKSYARWKLQYLVTYADYFRFKFDISPAKNDLFREAL